MQGPPGAAGQQRPCHAGGRALALPEGALQQVLLGVILGVMGGDALLWHLCYRRQRGPGIAGRYAVAGAAENDVRECSLLAYVRPVV